MEKNMVLMFPGQGSQSVGMGKELAASFPEFARTLEEASDALGYSMSNLCFTDENKQLSLTEYTQPSILTISVGVARILREQGGVIPSVVAGHSLGEYSALVALGTLDFSDALRAVRFRGQAMQRAVPVGVGAMAAYIGSQCDAVAELCRVHSRPNAVVEVVNYNSKAQMVLSGHKTAVEGLMKVVLEQKLGKAIALPVSAPFHSSLMQPAAQEMAGWLEKVKFNSFDGKIVANVDAAIHTSTSYSREHLVRQVASPVLWTESLNTLSVLSPEMEWIEVGPGSVLQGLLKKTLDGVREPMGTNDSAQVKNVLSKLGA